MHRTLRRPWNILGGLVALLLGVLPGAARAQTCSPESRPVVVLLNSTTRLQMASRKPIKTITNPKEGLLTIRTVERDPTVVVLVGVAPGISRLELEDADGVKEYREVIVQADIEYLAAQIHRAVPLSNVNIIPNGISTVIITGYVNRAEDIAVIMAIAQSVGFQVINGMRLNGVQQVQLDVVVALVDRSLGRNFGFNFLTNSRQTIGGSSVGNLIPTVGVVGVPSSILQPSTFGFQAINSAPGSANLFGGVISDAGGFLAFLEALEGESVIKLLAQPRLVTLSGNPASFLAGGEQAVPVPAGLGQVGVQFEEFGTRLNFLPVVLGNGRIHLEVEPEVSTLGGPGGLASTTISNVSVQGRQTQRIHTTVELETGQTFVIGGLIQRTVNGSTTKIPILGQLPFIGALFSTKTYAEDEEELVVLVTPHLVDAQSHDQLAKIIPGQESRSPDDFELFLEGILEAPRGPREVFQGTRYVPAFRNGPTADLYPCAGQNDGIHAPALHPAVGGAKPWSGGGAPCVVESEAPVAPAAKRQTLQANTPQAAQPSKILEGTPAPAAPLPPSLTPAALTPATLTPATLTPAAPATLKPAGDNAAGGQTPTVSAVPLSVPPPPSPLGGALSTQTPVAPAGEPVATTPASAPAPEASTPTVPSTGGTRQP